MDFDPAAFVLGVYDLVCGGDVIRDALELIFKRRLDHFLGRLRLNALSVTVLKIALPRLGHPFLDKSAQSLAKAPNEQATFSDKRRKNIVTIPFHGRLRLSNRAVPGMCRSLNGWSRWKSFGRSRRPMRFSRQPTHRHPPQGSMPAFFQTWLRT